MIDATAQAPVSVTEQATGPNGIATVTRSTTSVARMSAKQPVAVTRTEIARARACSSGNSLAAARTLALRIAYARALARAPHRRRGKR